MTPVRMRDLCPGLGAADHRANRDRHNFEQVVLFGALDPGIDQIDEGDSNGGHGMERQTGILYGTRRDLIQSG